MFFYFPIVFALIIILTIIITVVVYGLFNKEDENIVEINHTFRLICDDFSRISKDLKVLGSFVNDVAQPLLSPTAIDVESNEVELNTAESDSESINEANLSEYCSNDRPDIDLTEDQICLNKNTSQGFEPAHSDDLENISDKEKALYNQLVNEGVTRERLEEAMGEWRAKGNERLAKACAIALQELHEKESKYKDLEDRTSDSATLTD